MQRQHEWLLDLGRIPTGTSADPSPQASERERSVPSSRKLERNPAQLLAGLPFLQNLHLAQVQKILRSCCVGSYEDGDVVCAIDTPNNEMFILISGELAVLTQDGGQALTIDPVTTIGALSFITNRRHPIGLVATSHSKVLGLSRAKFDLVLSTDADLQTKVYKNIIDILADSLHKLRELVEGALAGTSPRGEGQE